MRIWEEARAKWVSARGSISLAAGCMVWWLSCCNIQGTLGGHWLSPTLFSHEELAFQVHCRLHLYSCSELIKTNSDAVRTPSSPSISILLPDGVLSISLCARETADTTQDS